MSFGIPEYGTKGKKNWSREGTFVLIEPSEVWGKYGFLRNTEAPNTEAPSGVWEKYNLLRNTEDQNNTPGLTNTSHYQQKSIKTT
jgi:hypothetical protein